MDTTITRTDFQNATKIVTLASVAVILYFPPNPDEIWWLKPLMVLAGAWSLWRSRSAFAVPIAIIGAVLLIRAFRRAKVRERILAADPLEMNLD